MPDAPALEERTVGRILARGTEAPGAAAPTSGRPAKNPAPPTPHPFFFNQKTSYEM